MEMEILGQVGRQLPDADPEHLKQVVRIGRYDEIYVLPLIQTTHLLSDEGSYFTVPINAGIGTGVASGTMPTAYSDTGTCFLALKNNDSTSNVPNGKRTYLDFIKLMVTAVGGSTTATGALHYLLRVDNINRASAGTAMTPVNANLDGTNSARTLVTAGAITLAASSGSAITVGRGVLRISNSATTMPVVVNDQFIIKSGSVETNFNATQLAVATAVTETVPVIPIVFGPQQTLSLQMWYPGITTPGTITFEGEVGWFER